MFLMSRLKVLIRRPPSKRGSWFYTKNVDLIIDVHCIKFDFHGKRYNETSFKERVEGDVRGLVLTIVEVKLLFMMDPN